MRCQAAGNGRLTIGERLYTKFPFYELIKQEAVDVLQSDICNAGGIALDEAVTRAHPLAGRRGWGHRGI